MILGTVEENQMKHLANQRKITTSEVYFLL